MMASERLKVDRALSIQPSSARTLRLVTTPDEDLRDTLPPTPATEPPPGFDPMPSDTMKKMTGYDPDQFLHVALAAAADAAHEIRESRKTHDVGALLEAAVKRLDDAAEVRSATRTREIKADFEITNNEMRILARRFGELEQTVREQVLPWMGRVDGRLESGDERSQRIEIGMAAMRRDFEALKARMDEFERAAKEGNHGATPPKTE